MLDAVCAAAELDVAEVDDAAEDDDDVDGGDAFSLPPQAVATVSTAVSPIPTLKIRTTLIVCLDSMSYLYGTHHLRSNIYCHRCEGGCQAEKSRIRLIGLPRHAARVSSRDTALRKAGRLR